MRRRTFIAGRSRKIMNTTLSIIIPTYNERSNIEPLLAKLDTALREIAWEVIFVDDNSPDGTSDLVRAIAANDARVRCLQRIGRKGLSSACIEGMCSSSSPFLAVMDADLQHDETLLPLMLDQLKQGNCDMVIGSRYMSGGNVGQWNPWRKKLSSWATKPAQLLGAATVSDPMSGFFMLHHKVLLSVVNNLTGIGFKILLDILASSPEPLKTKELPYTFRTRHSGDSKLNIMVITEYGMLLLDKFIGNYVPLRFASYVLVGSVGALLHLSILGISYLLLGMEFWIAQGIASVLVMILNYFFNNLFTYNDRRHKGSDLWLSLLKFMLICALGGFINVLIVNYLYQLKAIWWLAGLIGAGVSAAWNFGVSSQFVWNPHKK
jgi:dolichol-phosphate mannosyltransferase